MRKHALLSASGASKWLNCTPSAVLESKVKNVSSSYADEGTTAHTLAEIMLLSELGKINKKEYNKRLADEVYNSDFYNDAMHEYITGYVVDVMARYNSYEHATILLEQQYDLSKWVPLGYGHSDVSIISCNTLEIIDLKYGKGVAVSAAENKQQMLYALGALEHFGFLGSIDTVLISIYQPRIDNNSTWETTSKSLLTWANKELKQKAELAFDGKGELIAGDWCRFCKVKATCKAFAASQLALAKLDFAGVEAVTEDSLNSSLLTDMDIANILLKADLFRNWLNGIEKYALDKAVNESKSWPGLKLVHGRSIRRYTDTNAAMYMLAEKGFADDLYTIKKLKAITELEKSLGKQKFTELLTPYIDKPLGGPSLVSETDKRPAFNKVAEAKADFNDV